MDQQLDFNTHLQRFVKSLNHAVEAETEEAICSNVRSTLTETIQECSNLLPEDFVRPCSPHYARRLLHKDALGRYSVVVMVWDRGQGTAVA